MDAPESDPPSHVDLRSPYHPTKRFRQQSQKYYGFRTAPMSKIGQPVIAVLGHMVTTRHISPTVAHLEHLESGFLRTWTKQDQFQDRKRDIWPLDRKDHKVGRRKRGRNCNYVPPRREWERSMKGRRYLMEGDEWEGEDAEEQARRWFETLDQARGHCCACSESGELSVVASSHISDTDNADEEEEQDLLSGLNGADLEDDWEIVAPWVNNL